MQKKALNHAELTRSFAQILVGLLQTIHYTTSQMKYPTPTFSPPGSRLN